MPITRNTHSLKNIDPVTAKREFRKAILEWFENVAEDYPWRRTRDPYAVFVSELMLQQTQVATVLNKRYFENWMERYPTPTALHNADLDDVLSTWEGLGYYRRARNLKLAAEVIVDQHGGKFPIDSDSIRALPGVGDYTAGAVETFALGRSVPVVDANIARVLARLFDFQERIDQTQGRRQLWQWAAELVPQTDAGQFNSGLMELGQKICTPRSPNCQACPVSKWCQTASPESLPIKKRPTATVETSECVYLFIKNDAVLLQRETGTRRNGLNKLPSSDEATLGWSEISAITYAITRYRVRLSVLEAPPDHHPDLKDSTLFWCPVAELNSVAMGSPYRKVLRQHLQEPTLDS